MGLLPEDFYSMDAEDFWLLRKGWMDKLIYEQGLFRRVAYITHISMVQKPLSASKLWPLPGDKKIAKVTDKQLDILRKLKENEALEKYKNGRRDENTNRG